MSFLRTTPLLLSLIALSLFSSLPTRAYETDFEFGYSTRDDAANAAPDPHNSETESTAEVGPYKNPRDGTFYKKFQIIQKALGVEAEPSPDFRDFPRPNEINMTEVINNLKWFDTDEHNAAIPKIKKRDSLKRYLKFDEENSTISLFMDHINQDGPLLPKSFQEFTVKTKGVSGSRDSEELIETLNNVSRAMINLDNETPLKGLRVLIDPGHMGKSPAEVPGPKPNYWDNVTGKFVEVGGNYVSEGNLNLWTAYLVSNALEELGAEVKLTRTELKPVIETPYMSFDVIPFVAQFFYNSFDDWMLKHLDKKIDFSRAGSVEDLADDIRDDPNSKKAFQEKYKKNPYDSTFTSTLYTEAADLDARVKMADEFQPDLFLDIHYDAENWHELQSDIDKVSGYVPGNYLYKETGSRRIRALALKHLLEVRRWNESVALVDSITQSMSASLKIERDNQPVIVGAYRIKKGVYARNLYIPRRIRKGLIAYLECLHYDYPEEYRVLSKNNAKGNYHGLAFKYPARLNSVSSGIRDGILNFFKTRGSIEEQAK